MAFPNIRSRHVAIAFGFGALSTLIASWGELGLLYNAYPALLPFNFEQPDVLMILMAVVMAPFVEELAKPLGLYFLQAEEKPQFELKEWAFLGAVAGFGFAVVENMMYAYTVVTYGTDVSAWLLALRFLLPLHVVATAISSFGLGLWAKTKNAKYFAACIAVSMLLHGFYNLAATVVG
jgi:RsiW-degrading membrane proteinase PrsW (M82 family)